ncbi:ankyrin repeat domain-containing protein 16 [Anoplophora glabripennis]|uniref:ankyrin repeat domain-containing protein 16 n=1 Tax=Anoplophora glabripennis TaxID=217634 RepID=UPI000874E6B0|nr:ankyrin repeat domain-containing protein 16 [Anoplophora glabripennis]
MSDSDSISRPPNELLRRIRRGSENALQELFETEPTFLWSESYNSRTGDSVLHYAARLGLINILESIIVMCKCKCVDLKNKDDKTPLHEAAQCSQYRACEILLEHGANVDTLKRADWTPLMLACTKIIGEDSYKTVNVLLENNALVECKNKDGWTAFHLVCRSGDLTILKMLLRKNVDVYQETYNGRTGLHIAALHGNLEIVRILLDLELEPDRTDSCGNTALHDAVLGDNIEVCKLLINYGAHTRFVNSRGFSILHMAVSQGFLEIVEYILKDLNFDINEKTNDGYTVLHCAAKQGHKELHGMLIFRGADNSITDNFGRFSNQYF